MMEDFPIVYLAANGETTWTSRGRHASMTDLPLTERGEAEARALKRRLQGLTFAKVITSPLQRDRRMCDLAGFSAMAEIDSDLMEWNFGIYEGQTEAEIFSKQDKWYLFRDGCPRGESPSDVAERADRLISRLRATGDDLLLFSSTDFIRVLAFRWTGFSLSANARRFLLYPASLSAVGYNGSLSRPVIRLWNDTRHTFRSSPHREAAS
jgi:broad specificity phosphatase PhoE